MSTSSLIHPRDYIRIDSLPADEQAPFSDWIYPQTCPIEPHELDANGKPARCAYRWDYDHWRNAYLSGKEAVPLD